MNTDSTTSAALSARRRTTSRRRSVRWPFTIACLVIGACSGGASAPAFAQNGLNLIGFGAESILMGGADTAVARDTFALQNNPAGLTRLRRRQLDTVGSIAKALDVSHADALGNDEKVSNDLVGALAAGYAQSIAACACTIGVAGFVQGGAGYRYDDLMTPFGTRDNLASLLAIARLQAGVAFAPTDRLTVGASVGILYASLKQRIFPATSVFNPIDPTQSFFGASLDHARAARPGLRLGAQYAVSPDVTLGFVYAPRTSLPLTDGSLRVNYSAIGLGTVTYGDASVHGLSQPEEIAAGVAWQASPALLLSAKLEWLGWARALDSITLHASRPDNAFAPPEVELVTQHGWKNQWVWAAGSAYSVSDRLTWYAGLNYGSNPVPSEHLTPLLAGIVEWDITTGVAWKIAPGWSLTGGIEYQVHTTARSTDPTSLLGPGSIERANGVVVPVMLSAQW